MKSKCYARIVQNQISVLRHLAANAHRRQLEFIQASKYEMQRRRDYNRLARVLKAELTE